MVIDFHHHLFNRDWLPQKFWDDMVRRVVSMRRLTGQPADPEEIAKSIYDAFADPHGDVLAAKMEKAGIDYTLIMPLDLGLELGECPVAIEEKKPPDRGSGQAPQRRYRGVFRYRPQARKRGGAIRQGGAQLGHAGPETGPGRRFLPK